MNQWKVKMEKSFARTLDRDPNPRVPFSFPPEPTRHLPTLEGTIAVSLFLLLLWITWRAFG